MAATLSYISTLDIVLLNGIRISKISWLRHLLLHLYGWALVKDLPFIIILGMPIFLSLLSLATVLISTGSYSGLRGTLSLQLISISPFIQQSVTNLATTTCQGSRHYSRHYRQQSEQVLYVLQWRKHRMDWRHTGENLDSGRESCKEGHPEKAEGSVRN